MTTVLESIDALPVVFEEIAAAWNKADYEKELEAEQPHLQKMESGFFDSERSPSGDAWPPLAPSTVRRKGNSRILVDSERLRKSLVSGGDGAIFNTVSEGRNQGLAFGTRVVDPQSGTAYPALLMKGTSRMPARPHTGFSVEYVDKASNRFADASVEKIKE